MTKFPASFRSLVCFRSKNLREGASELCTARVFITWLAHGLLAGGLLIFRGGGGGGYTALTIIDGFAGTEVV